MLIMTCSDRMWLRCTVGKGQFDDERAVRGEDHQGATFSLFVSRDDVRPSDQKRSGEGEVADAEVCVAVLAEENEYFLVCLPGQTFENGRTITVHRSQLDNNATRQEA